MIVGIGDVKFVGGHGQVGRGDRARRVPVVLSFGVRVQDGELRVGTAVLPLRSVGRVEVVDRRDKQAALGPELDPAAFVLHRGWVGPLVRLEVTDPDDPTPYWVFSVREPDRLLAALAGGASDRRSS